jgi:hypothetical protein
MKNFVLLFLLILISVSTFGEVLLNKNTDIIKIIAYKGSINNKYKIFANISITSGKISGSYRYLTQKKYIYLEGFLKNNEFKVTEKVYDMNTGKYLISGYFYGIFTSGTISGIWRDSVNTKSLPFELVPFYEVKQAEYKFETTSEKDKNGYHIKKIGILADKKLIQQITLNFDSQELDKDKDYNENSEEIIYMEDINFDGYLDFFIQKLTSRGSSGDVSFISWVYNTEIDKFDRINYEINSEFGELNFDHVNKELRCIEKSSAAEHIIKYYKYQNLIYILSGYIEESRIGNRVIYREYKNVNGKPVFVSEDSELISDGM